MLKLLKKAKEENRPIEFIYFSPSSNTCTKRKVKVLSLNSTHLKGYCYLRNSLRTFSLDQILAIQPANTPSIKRKNPFSA
ncbi:hypothetical protein Q73_04260 [Bacillus coahuilensis m2-6]|uniref:WYL domain-containing protein n=1 Tax=Bacillus coahuilensis TaxID=408580 RepID=UPI0001850F89|nr:WYL domain-containing protein [Bacillus coahuilensis]KUP08942.1 hypothetical protein Q73_04260 [Bacillus coahuilensis m2-6]